MRARSKRRTLTRFPLHCSAPSPPLTLMAAGSIRRVVWVEHVVRCREATLRLLGLLLLQNGQLPLHLLCLGLRNAASLHQSAHLRVLVGLQLCEIGVHLRVLLHLHLRRRCRLLLLCLLYGCSLLHLHDDLLLQLRLNVGRIVLCLLLCLLLLL